MNEKDFLRLEGKIDALMRHLGCTGAPRAQGSAAPSAPLPTGEVASDHDLDGEHGDQLVKKDPTRYKGPPMAPRKMSQGTAEWLDSVAEFHTWRAGKCQEEGKDPKWPLLDAARARGWAARIRGGWKAPKSDDPDWVTGDIDDGSADAWHSQHDT